VKIKVEAIIDTDDLDYADVDLSHEMGLSSSGYEKLSMRLMNEGLDDLEFILLPKDDDE